jgi:bacterioferritin
MTGFLSDVDTLRRRAREHIDEGPITEAYGADRERVIAVLNEVLATELVCYLRYQRHYYTANGLSAAPVAAQFLEHANEERGHADMVAKRITELRGEPNFNPDGLSARAHAQYVEGDTLLDMVKEDLVAERIAITSYQEIVRWLGEGDPTTQEVIKTILAVEEEHANDMINILEDMGTHAGDGHKLAT